METNEYFFDHFDGLNSFCFHNFSPREVHNAIIALDNKYSLDCFSLSNFILKKISFNICNILAYLFNESITSGTFPSILKCATIIPLFKKGDKNVVQNYRPISLLPVVAKLFEKLVKIRILKYIDVNNILHNNQYGFRAGMCTEDALINFVSQINKAFDVKEFVSSLFIDVSKAFDTVDHSLLLSKLYKYGFRGFIHSWFKSYLSNRSQIVRVGDKTSEVMYVQFGVPQGSVLGPILFLLYVNSMYCQPFHGKIISFADDTSFFYNGASKSDLLTNINSDLCLLRKWFNAHCLVLSDKTKIMSFALTSHKYIEYNVIFHDLYCNHLSCTNKCFEIEQVQTFKYLGLNFDCSLNWKCHVNQLKTQSWALIKMLYLVRQSCPASILRLIYVSLGASKYEYCLSIWGSVCKSNVNSVNVCQKYMMRIICNKPRMSHSWPLFTSLEILPLRHLFVYKVLRLFFLRSGQRALRFVDSHNVRGNRHVYVIVPRYRTSHFFRSFSVIGPVLFNKLPEHIKSMQTLNKFLFHLKKFLFSIQDIDSLLSSEFS